MRRGPTVQGCTRLTVADAVADSSAVQLVALAQDRPRRQAVVRDQAREQVCSKNAFESLSEARHRTRGANAHPWLSERSFNTGFGR